MAKIVLTTFKGEHPITIKDPTTEHINGNRQDNRCDNLIWMERIENASTRNNKGKGENNSKAILSESDVKKICKLFQKGKYTIQQIANRYNVSTGCISSIKQRKNWTYITNKYQW